MENKQQEMEKQIKNRLQEDAKKLDIPLKIQPIYILDEINGRKKSNNKTPKRRNWYKEIGTLQKVVVAVASIAIVVLVGSVVGNNLGKNNSDQDLALNVDSHVTNKGDGKEVVADNYDSIYELIQKAVDEQKRDVLFGDFVTEDMESSGVTDGTDKNASQSLNDSTSSDKNFSSTNVQVNGVDEGDIIKNDGDYLYCLSGNQIKIIKADGASLVEKASVKIKGDVTEFYVQDDRLIAVYTEYDTTVKEQSDLKYGCYFIRDNTTVVAIYDINNRSNPKLLKEYKQDGYQVSSRISDGYLYLFTNKSVYGEIKKEEVETYVPKVDGKLIDASNIAIIPNIENVSSYLIMSSIQISNPTKVVAKKAILSGAFQFYVSENNIYSVENTTVYPYYRLIDDVVVMQDTDSTTTTKETTSPDAKQQKTSAYTSSRVLKYSYKDGIIDYVASADFDGTIKDQYSMDEYKGNLRVVSTVDSCDGNAVSYNNLYVFDENLKKLGEIKKLAKDERIYSSRFMGDTGYFVTFRQVDPLFSVDLSDPKNPKILGELKITGFSSYLHFYGKNLLLGIGQEVDPKTNEILGVKLSMFDISDPSNVKEIHKKVIKELQYGEFLYNPKAIMISTENNIFGFAGYGAWNSDSSFDKYFYVFSYDSEKGFIEKQKVSYTQKMDKEVYYDYSIRGSFIGDTLYVFSLIPNYMYQDATIKYPASKIISYNFTSGKQSGTFELKE